MAPCFCSQRRWRRRQCILNSARLLHHHEFSAIVDSSFPCHLSHIAPGVQDRVKIKISTSVCSQISLNRRTCLGRLLRDLWRGHKSVLVCSCVSPSNGVVDGVLLSLNVIPFRHHVALWRTHASLCNRYRWQKRAASSG